MRRELPTYPNLEHLKKQAKDLLDGHRRGDAEALVRIREALPAFAKMSDEDAARAPFALHDAQSAVAREYGVKSWSDLRNEVASRIADEPPSAELLRALMNAPMPDSVVDAIRNAWTRRERSTALEPSAMADALPLLGLRNALLAPGSIAPIQVARARSKAAIESALASDVPAIAVFAQRAEETEEINADSLHPIGCVAFVRAEVADGERAWIILEGMRWITLASVESTESGRAAHWIARFAAVHAIAGDTDEVSGLAEKVREEARPLARALPGGSRHVAMLDTLDAEPLADLIIANLPVPVAEKVRFAAEPRLAERLRIASTLLHAVATSSRPPWPQGG